MLRIASLSLLLAASLTACTTDDAREVTWSSPLDNCDEVTVRTTFASGRSEVNRELLCNGAMLVIDDEVDPPTRITVTGFHVSNEQCEFFTNECVRGTKVGEVTVDLTDAAIDPRELELTIR